MKFWEALKEMEAGAVCAPVQCDGSDGMSHRFVSGRLAVWDAGIKRWIDSPAMVNGSWGDWRIVTPAPSEAKPEPVVNFEESATDAAHRRITETQKRVEALEERAEIARCWLKSHGASNVERDERLNALEAKLAALDNRLESHSHTNVLRDSRLAALEASKPQPNKAWEIPYKPEDYATQEGLAKVWAEDMRAQSPAPAVAWPKGSLQWAETEAKRRGLPYVHRKPLLHIKSRPKSFWADEVDRYSLDWEPCE